MLKHINLYRIYTKNLCNQKIFCNFTLVNKALNNMSYIEYFKPNDAQFNVIADIVSNLFPEEIIPLINEYETTKGRKEYSIYPMSELNTYLMNYLPTDVLEKCSDNFNLEDEWFIDDDGYIKTSNNPITIMRCDCDDLAEYLIQFGDFNHILEDNSNQICSALSDYAARLLTNDYTINMLNLDEFDDYVHKNYLRKCYQENWQILVDEIIKHYT